MSAQEYSESGNPIYRYENNQDRKFKPVAGGGEHLELISDHIENHVGKIE